MNPFPHACIGFRIQHFSDAGLYEPSDSAWTCISQSSNTGFNQDIAGLRSHRKPITGCNPRSPSPHNLRRLLLQPSIRRCDKSDGRRARPSVGQQTVSRMPPSLVGGSEACLVHASKRTSLLRRTIRDHKCHSRPEKILNVSSEYAPVLSRPTVKHLPAPHSPRPEGHVGRATRRGKPCRMAFWMFRHELSRIMQASEQY